MRLYCISLIILVLTIAPSAQALTMRALDGSHNNQPIANGQMVIITVNSDLSFNSDADMDTLLNSVNSVRIKTDVKGYFELDYPAGTTISGSAYYKRAYTNKIETVYCNGNMTTARVKGDMTFKCYFLGN